MNHRREPHPVSRRLVTCVWCGHAFRSTERSQAEHLFEHAKICKKHPVSELVKRIESLKRELKEAQGSIEALLRIIRVAGTPEAQKFLEWKRDRDRLEGKNEVLRRHNSRLQQEVERLKRLLQEAAVHVHDNPECGGHPGSSGDMCQMCRHGRDYLGRVKEALAAEDREEK